MSSGVFRPVYRLPPPAPQDLALAILTVAAAAPPASFPPILSMANNPTFIPHLIGR